MRISVLVVMPPQRELRMSAKSAATTGSAKLSIEKLPSVGSLVLDDRFAAIPLPSTMAEAASPKMATAAKAPAFVARGTVEVASMADVPFEQDGVRIYSDPEIGLFPVCGGDPPVGNAKTVAKLLELALLHKPKRKLDGTGVAVAIVDTGINIAHLKKKKLKPKLDKTITIAPPGVPSTPGQYPVDHGTMCAYDALIAAPKATLIDMPTLLSQTPGGSVMQGFLSDAIKAYAYLLNALSSKKWKYKALVVNNSWGMFHPSWDFPAGHPGRYADNPNHPFNIVVGTLAAAGADIIFAAGNCGANCPDGRCQNVVTHSITGANAHADVLTLAGADTTDKRVGYSSQGPAIPGMTTNKPDVTSYTHFLGSEAFGSGQPDSGTSTACPVAAGCVAALRTKLKPSKVPPATLFAAFRQFAKPKGPAGWNGDYGHGILKPQPVAMHFNI